MTTEERKKYVVFKANILDDEGVKRKDGDIVSLKPKTAKHYNKLGYLRPYMEDDDEDDDDAELGDEEAEPVRSNRVASQPARSRLQASAAALKSLQGEGNS